MKVLVSPEFIVVFFLISWLALGPLPTQAALRYVDPDHGSDVRGDATKENPVKTIERAFDFAKAGDTLYLESGTFESIVLPKALGVWGNPEDKATIKGPISFGSQVTGLVDLYYRDLIITGSQGFSFDKSIAIDGVQFDRLELQISGSGVFIGGSGQLNMTGDGLLFNSLEITSSGSGSSAVDISVSSGPIIFSNLTVKGNNLKFNIANTPKNVQLNSLTLNGAQFSISDPAGIQVTNCTFTQSGLSVVGGYGTISFNNFTQITSGAVIDLSSPTLENNRFEYEIMNNTFQTSYKGLDLSLEPSSPLQLVFHTNFFPDADGDVKAIILTESSSITIDAKNNWWGSDSGPTEEFCNPDGKGAAIIAPSSEAANHVSYIPWCSVEDCSVTKLVRSACAAGDDPASFIEDDADSMTPWGMSILIIAVCSISYLVFLVIFFFALKLRQNSSSQKTASDEEKLT